MFEWLKRLVARRELEELDRWRVECVEARRWFGEFPEVSHALDYLAGFAKGTGGGRIDQAREKMRSMRAADVARASSNPFLAPLRVPKEHSDPAWIERFAGEWRDASHESLGRCIARFEHPIFDFSRPPVLPGAANVERDGGVDYRFLGMTGEEDA
ncbi:hypothetical protein [Burkholderia cenocepacia]|uniref:hypothetical protein n=1 Tax=Burkholderia cenocepacia TaxID=95486 RepID=UPI00158DA0F5|nr:hypothetical protein [Burkholderia cenocepacia]